MRQVGFAGPLDLGNAVEVEYASSEGLYRAGPRSLLVVGALLLTLAVAVVVHHANLLEQTGSAHASSICKGPPTGDALSAGVPADSACEWPLPAPAAGYAELAPLTTATTADARAGPARLQVFLL